MEGCRQRRGTQDLPLQRCFEGSRVEEELWVKAYETVLSLANCRQQRLQDAPMIRDEPLSLVGEGAQDHG